MSTADSLEYRMFSEHPLWPAVERNLLAEARAGIAG